MGYCKHCGNILFDDRCKCGGSKQDATAKGLLAADHVDKWKTKYVTQSPASAAATPRPSTSRQRPKPSYDEYAEALEQDAPSPTVSLIRSRSHASSASGELSSVFGSVLSPGDNMRCVDCHVRFKQEATIYPHPDAKKVTGLSDTFFCRSCFAERFSKGDCKRCKCAVLSDAPFVTHGDQVWHSTCYTCSYCSVPCQSIVMDLAGKPSCEPCFDSAAYRTAGIPPSPHLAQSGAFSRPLALRPAPSRWGTKSTVTSPTTKLAPAQNKVPGWQVKTARETSAMAPSFDELASKMRLVGLKEATTKATTSVQVCATASPGTQVPPVSWLARKPAMSPIATSPFKLHTDSGPSSPALPVKVSSPATGRSPSPIRSNVFMTRDAANPSPSSSPIRSSSPVRMLSARGDHSPTRTPSLIRLFGDGTSPKRASILTPRVATTESISPPKKEPTAPSKSWLNLASTTKMEPAVSPFKEPLPLLRPLGTRSRTLSTSPIRTSHLTPKIPPTTSLPASPPKSLVLPGGTHSLSNPSAHLSTVPSRHVVLPDVTMTQENCGVCRRDLGHEGEFVQVQGVGVLHRACFTCGGCEQELGSGKYLMVEQRVFHDKCAPPTVKRTVVPRSPKQSAIREEVDVETLVGIPTDGCKGCGKGVREGLMITIPRTGDSYHQECFKCGGCGVGFGVVDGERSFVEREGTPYHSRCAPLPTTPSRARASERPIQHSSSRVHIPLPAPPPTLIRSPSSQLSVSRTIFSSRTRPPANLGGLLVCSGCSVRATEKETVKGPMGGRYHPKCLVCGVCKKAVDSENRGGEGGLRCVECREGESRRSGMKARLTGPR